MKVGVVVVPYLALVLGACSGGSKEQGAPADASVAVDASSCVAARPNDVCDADGLAQLDLEGDWHEQGTTTEMRDGMTSPTMSAVDRTITIHRDGCVAAVTGLGGDSIAVSDTELWYSCTPYTGGCPRGTATWSICARDGVLTLAQDSDSTQMPAGHVHDQTYATLTR